MSLRNLIPVTMGWEFVDALSNSLKETILNGSLFTFNSWSRLY